MTAFNGHLAPPRGMRMLLKHYSVYCFEVVPNIIISIVQYGACDHKRNGLVIDEYSNWPLVASDPACLADSTLDLLLQTHLLSGLLE